jgi:hypothetical protein
MLWFLLGVVVTANLLVVKNYCIITLSKIAIKNDAI